MLVISDQIKPTIQRYRDRHAERTEAKEKLKKGLVLEADTPERVGKRIERLARQQFEETVRDPRADEAREGGRGRGLVGLERLIGRSDLMPVSYLERGVQVARSVGRVQIRNRSFQTIGYGTGFFVAPGLLLTNNHVLSDATEAATSRVELDYQDGADGRRIDSILLDLDPRTLFFTNRELDFSLVAVHDPDGTLAAYGWNPLIEEEGKAIVGDYLGVVQHPRGEPKQIALRENRLLDVLENFVHYETDTAQGSSGSPVFNDAWEVVALHHSGVPKQDRQGRYLMKDGTIWQDGMDDSLIDWTANEGVRVSRIVRAIKAAQFDASQQALIDGLFATREESLPRNGGGSSGRGQGGQDVVVDRDGRATWTVPVAISLQVGGGALGLTPQRASATRPAPRPVAPVVPPPREQPAADVDAAGLKDALDELERARKRPYYQEARDQQDRDAYYNDIAGGLSRRALYRALNRLLTRTHTRQPAYKPAKLVYPWVDLREDRRIRSIYSGKGFAPEELIREDFRIERKRAQLRESFLLEAATGGRSAQEALDLLEASLPYNCEHVVPQSWFRKAEPMKGDLHHLFACESGCNSFRNNIPYYDFPDFEEAIRDACGKREQNRFEPSHGKGPVARATLYFLLRYPGEINRVAAEYTEDRIRMIVTWHDNDPPTKYELHRNAAIFEMQGNRNPLIDHPDWSGRIDFNAGLGDDRDEDLRVDEESPDVPPVPPLSGETM